MSASRHFVGIALALSIITPSWAAQRTVLKSLTACPYVKDFTDWFEAMEKGNSSRAFELIDGKGCIEVNKGDLVEFERLRTPVRRLCSSDRAVAVFLDIALRNFTTTTKTMRGSSRDGFSHPISHPTPHYGVGNGDTERSAARQESVIFQNKTGLDLTGQDGRQGFRKPLLYPTELRDRALKTKHFYAFGDRPQSALLPKLLPSLPFILPLGRLEQLQTPRQDAVPRRSAWCR
jgi:hypothetical protein